MNNDVEVMEKEVVLNKHDDDVTRCKEYTKLNALIKSAEKELSPKYLKCDIEYLEDEVYKTIYNSNPKICNLEGVKYCMSKLKDDDEFTLFDRLEYTYLVRIGDRKHYVYNHIACHKTTQIAVNSYINAMVISMKYYKNNSKYACPDLGYYDGNELEDFAKYHLKGDITHEALRELSKPIFHQALDIVARTL